LALLKKKGSAHIGLTQKKKESRNPRRERTFKRNVEVRQKNYLIEQLQPGEGATEKKGTKGFGGRGIQENYSNVNDRKKPSSLRSKPEVRKTKKKVPKHGGEQS